MILVVILDWLIRKVFLLRLVQDFRYKAFDSAHPEPPREQNPFRRRASWKPKPSKKIATMLEAEDHKKTLTMVVTVCGHMQAMNKIAQLAAKKTYGDGVKTQKRLAIVKFLGGSVRGRPWPGDYISGRSLLPA